MLINREGHIKYCEERKIPKLRKRWRLQAENNRKKHPDKIKAHNKVQCIKIPRRTKCKYCNNLAIEKHHPDYTKPKLIVFVCKKCHTKIHGGGQLVSTSNIKLR